MKAKQDEEKKNLSANMLQTDFFFIFFIVVMHRLSSSKGIFQCQIGLKQTILINYNNKAAADLPFSGRQGFVRAVPQPPNQSWNHPHFSLIIFKFSLLLLALRFDCELFKQVLFLIYKNFIVLFKYAIMGILDADQGKQ